MLPCSMCDRISLAKVTLRIDSPWPVQDTAPLVLSAYPPQPGLHEKHTVIIKTTHIWGKHLSAQLLVIVKLSRRTDNGRVSNSADHFISDPSGGGCAGNVASRVDSNCSHRVMGPAGRRQDKSQHIAILGIFDTLSCSDSQISSYHLKLKSSLTSVLKLLCFSHSSLSFAVTSVSVGTVAMPMLFANRLAPPLVNSKWGVWNIQRHQTHVWINRQYRSDDGAAPFPSPPVPGRLDWGCSSPKTQHHCQAFVHP